jgi:hypothetical protein
MELVTMISLKPYLWGIAVLLVAILNIVGVLPDWTTIAAILTLPFVAAMTGMRCGRSKEA